jgi:hypothetical protein
MKLIPSSQGIKVISRRSRSARVETLIIFVTTAVISVHFFEGVVIVVCIRKFKSPLTPIYKDGYAKTQKCKLPINRRLDKDRDSHTNDNQGKKMPPNKLNGCPGFFIKIRALVHKLPLLTKPTITQRDDKKDNR